MELDPPGESGLAAGLAPVGVRPALQGQGIGTALIRAGLEAARERGWRAVAQRALR